MKNLIRYFLLALPVLINSATAQNIAINTDGSTPDASAMLDIASTSKGLLVPRMTTTQQNAIASPATGLLIFNTTENIFKANTGTPSVPVWTGLTTSSTGGWLLTGNAATSAANFIGTTDNRSLRFRTNNAQQMIVDSTGRVGIGSATFNTSNPEKLLVDAGTTTSVNTIVGKGNINSYLQLNIQNQSSGAYSSSDVVATANNGDESSNYVDMGINGGSYSGGFMGSANDGYLYTMGNNFLLGTGNASKSLIFLTGGTSQAANERMRIDGSGNIGIGVTNPSYKLQVSAASNPLQLTGLQTGSNADSILTVSNGVVRRLHVSALATSSTAWSLVGNASTNPATNFIGTTDAQALVIKQNNTQVGRFDANSLALGNGASISNSTHSYSIGSGATVGFNKTAAMALGNNSAINADSSFAIGTAAVTNGSNSFAIGNGATSNNTNSFAIGRNAVTAYSITDAVAIGTNATANSSNSIAIGSNTVSANKTTTNAASAIALGNAAVSNSTNAIAIGTGASTGYNLTNPVAIGVSTMVNGNNGVAIGNGANISSVSNTTVIGSGASATTNANNSTAIGYNTDITKANEIILGDMSNSALSVGIGSENFSSSNREKLLVDAGTTTSVNAIVGKGSIDSYLQLNIQNNSAGTSASSDVVATANNGNETSNYVDMGINGGNYSGGVMGSANDGYLYTMGNNFLLGTGNASKSLIFMTGGTSQAANERMRIDGSGNVGIGVTNPSYKLQVNASSNPLQLSGLQTGTNADSILTVSNGVVKRLSPSSLNTASTAWALTGNTGSATTKLGTTNSYDLPIITNNTTKMTITSGGNIGIGSTDFDDSQPEKLLVDAGTGASNNIIGAYGDVNNYVQIGVQNRNSGNSASSDIVATADNGTNTTNYIDMGINSSGYSNNASNILNRPNVGYLYTNATADFFIGNGAPNQDMILFTNSGSAGNTTANGFEAMRIDGNGNVGIGGTSRNNSGVATTNPEKLVVSGNVVPRTSGSGNLGTSTYKWNSVYATNGTIQTSDRRMKTNIATLKYGLKEIMAMRPVTFNWKTTPDSNKKVGLIAQELKEIVPEVVTGDETKETLGVNYAELVPVLINAVKEQQKEIAELKESLQKLLHARP